MPRSAVAALVLLVLTLGACTEAPTASEAAGLAGGTGVAAIAGSLAPAPQAPTASASQFRWLEPVGVKGNALGKADNDDAYAPFLRVELCTIASVDAPCGATVPGSVITSATGLGLTGGGKAYSATLRLKDLALDAAQRYRLRVLLMDPSLPGATPVQVGYQNLSIGKGGCATGDDRDSDRDSDAGRSSCADLRVQAKQSLPVKFILGPGVVRGIAIAPALDTISVGSARTYTASLVDWSGNTAQGTVEWLVGDPTIAGLTSGDAGASVAALALGSTTLFASANGVTTSLVLRVLSPVATVELVQSPANPVTVGTSVALTATARNAAGAVITSRPFTWSGAAGSGATAALTPAAAGDYPVSVSVDGVAASLTVHAVNPSPTGPTVAKMALGAAVVTMNVGDDPVQPISATLWDAQGIPITGRTVTWASSNPAVVTVDATGRLHGVAPGYAYVSGSADGVSARLVAIVTPMGGGIGGTIGSIVVLPPDATIAANDTVRLVAVVLDVNGAPMNYNNQIAWNPGSGAVTLSASTGNTIVAKGVASPIAQQVVNVTASAGGVNGVSRITVNSPTVPPVTDGTIIITPNPVNLDVGQNAALTAEVRDLQGHVITGLQVIWTVGNQQVASVSPNGYSATLSALGGGITTVRATAGGLTGTATVNVTAPPPPPPPVASLTVTPVSATITQSGCVQLAATYTVNGVASDVTQASGWSSGSGYATVTKGLVCGKGNITNGRNQVAYITASYNGASSVATITITP